MNSATFAKASPIGFAGRLLQAATVLAAPAAAPTGPTGLLL